MYSVLVSHPNAHIELQLFLVASKREAFAHLCVHISEQLTALTSNSLDAAHLSV